MRFPLGLAAVAILVTCSGCGGSGGSGGNPGAPSPPATGSSVVSIVGDRGAQSFSPNPGSGGGQDQTIAWRNNDIVTHRIVSNDGSFDSGDIPAGGVSRVIQVPVAGTNYHCSIHPGMIGSLSASGGAPPPPCTGIYC